MLTLVLIVILVGSAWGYIKEKISLDTFLITIVLYVLGIILISLLEKNKKLKQNRL